MATAFASGIEDFVTCGVCLCEFDSEKRKPKFLQCSHTICLQCLKEIHKDGMIICPFCRNNFAKADVTNLPNNSYVLHMLKFNEKKVIEESTLTAASLLDVSWCLTCGSVEKHSCEPLGHTSVNISADTIRNLDAHLHLKEELLQMKDQGTNKLAMAIQKRKEVQEHLALTLKSIKAAEDEVEKLQDENNLRLTEMISILERKKNAPAETNLHQDGNNKASLHSKLMDLVDGALPEDTAETLKFKMAKTVQLYEQMLSEAETVASEYDLRQKIKICISLRDENQQPIATCNWLENGFNFNSISSPGLAVMGPIFRQDLLLISHAVFSFIRWQKINLKVAHEQQPTAHSASSVPKSQNKTQSSLPPTVLASSNSKFILDQSSIFILKMFQSGNLKGEIHIRPLPTFHPIFVQKLGDFCYKSPKNFCKTIEKALASVVVLFPMAHSLFQPVVPSLQNIVKKDAAQKKANTPESANRAGDVGMIFVTTSPGVSNVTGWSFVFPLGGFQSSKYKEHVKTEAANELFGHVIHQPMLEAMTMLSLTSKSARAGYMMTLESR